MNALNDLAAEVHFRERLRGYDYDEVDDYVKAVGKAAVETRGLIAELQSRLNQLESRPPDDDGMRDDRETLVRTLLLAQRTADSTVAEAQSQAEAITETARERAVKAVAEAEADASSRIRSANENAAQTLAEADEKAAQTLAEAGGNAARLLAEADESSRLIVAETKRTAAAEMAVERDRAREQLRVMEEARAELEVNVAFLRGRLADERAQLHRLSASLSSFVDGIEAEPSIDRPEERSATVVTDIVVDAETRPHTGVAAEPEALGRAAEDPGDPTQEALTIVLPESDSVPEFMLESGELDEMPQGGPEPVPEVPLDQWSREGAYLPPSAVRPHVPEQSASDAGTSTWSASDTEATTWSASGTGTDGNGSSEPEPAGPHTLVATMTSPVATQSMAAIGVNTPELFDVDAEEDDEFIEQLRRVVSSDAPLPDTDAAMAAFFDHDETAGRGGGGLVRGYRLSPRV